MGKRKQFRRKGGNRDHSSRGMVHGNRDVFIDIEKSNALFEKFYKENNIVGDDEWDTFLSVLNQELPTTFRFTASRSHAATLKSCIADIFEKIQVEANGDVLKINPPEELPWYPEGLAMHFKFPKSQLKKTKGLGPFQSFLVSETEIGNISRQEEVSMIPPLLLDVQPHHKVLDMCAAPGSKTAQIIEAMHSNEGSLPEGLLIANDVHPKRAYMLVHQTKRLHSPCLLVTNHDSRGFPNIINRDDGTPLYFDRILCDVPCSGDGTLRKNAMIWQKWNPSMGLGLHKTQKGILERACQMVAVNGKVVYSTCSFNPIENEAVVAAVMKKYGDSLELLDCSEELKGLKRSPGMHSWKVMSKKGNLYSAMDDIAEDDKAQYGPSLFSDDESKKLPLERCIRVFPHQQDTGGFFIAVLRKIKPITKADKQRQEADNTISQDNDVSEDLVSTEIFEQSSEKEEEESNKRKSESNDNENVKRPRMEAPFVFIPKGCDESSRLIDHFDMSGEHISKLEFFVRSEEKKNNTVYCTTQAVMEVLRSANAGQLQVVNAGVRAFSRQRGAEVSPNYRLHNEGCQILIQSMGQKRRVSIEKADLMVLFSEEYPKYDGFSKETRDRLESLGLEKNSCCVFEYNDVEGSTKEVFYFPIWLSPVSLSLLLSKPERESVARRLAINNLITTGLSYKTISEQRQNKIENSETAVASPSQNVVATEE